MLLRFIPLILVSISVLSGELDDKNLVGEQETVNFCLDKQSALDNEQLARETPNDVQLIRLVAIRAGLCDLISKNIIELESQSTCLI